jgi:hypothetical protein
VGIHDVFGTDGRRVGNVGTVKRKFGALLVLSLAPLAGVSCGDQGRADVEPPVPGTVAVEMVRNFRTLGKISLVDQGQWCATLSVGAVISYDNCFRADEMPQLVSSESSRGLVLLAVRSGNTVSFPDGNVRVLATSEYWVAAQMSTDVSIGDLRFKVTSERGVRYCVVDPHLAVFCQY